MSRTHVNEGAPLVDTHGVCFNFDVTIPKGTVVTTDDPKSNRDGKPTRTRRSAALEPFKLGDPEVRWAGSKGSFRSCAASAVRLPAAATRAIFAGRP